MKDLLHGIERGHALSPAEMDHVLSAIERWLRGFLE
jgi:hypothetical protein